MTPLTQPRKKLTINKTRRRILASLLGLAALTIAGCSGQRPGEASKEVNVYSSRHYDSDNQLYKNFTQATGIQVNLIEGDADQLIERIKSEGANSPADVFITVDAGRLWRAETAEILQPIDSAKLKAAVPENLRHPQGLWFGLTKRARAIAYDKERVKPSELSTYENLADPKWKNRLCVRSSNNIYNQSLVASMIETEGVQATEKWAKGLVANFARPPEGGDVEQIKALGAGECDVAIVNHYYWARLATSQDPQEQAVANQVGIFFPNQQGRGAHINISGAGVAKGAPHQKNAVAFIEYMVTPEAQEIFAQGNNEYPVVSGLKLSPVVTELGDFKSDAVNVSAYGRNNPEAVKLMDRVGWK